MKRNLTIARNADWKPRLIAYLEKVARLPHVYGTHDCFLFPAEALHVMTGVDIAEGIRGEYGSARAGIKILMRKGHRNHVDYLASFLKEKPVARANPGDIAVVPGDGLDHLGVVQGRAIYALRPNGLGLVPLLSATRMFEVPWDR